MKGLLRSLLESAVLTLLGFLLYNWLVYSPDLWASVRPVADLMVLWLVIAEPVLALVATATFVHRHLNRTSS